MTHLQGQSITPADSPLVLSVSDPTVLESLGETLADDVRPPQAMSRLKSWLGKGSLAIIDQGLISGSNFVASILLARWLSPESYGAYAVAFGIFVLMTLVYGALILEPMSVFGGAEYRNRLRPYFSSLLRIHLAIGVAAFCLIGLAAAVTRGVGLADGLPGALLGVAVATPCVLLLWLARRAFYLNLASSRAVTGSSLYFVLMLGGLVVLDQRSLISPLTAFLLIGAAALVADAVLLVLLPSELGVSTFSFTPTEVWRKHWRYGRWALLSCFAAWIPAYIFYPLLTSFASTAQAGELKALTNFINPLDQTLAALSLLFLPYAARVRSEQGRSGIMTLTRNLIVLSIGGSLVYWALVVQFREPLFRLLYSGRYENVTHLLPVIAMGSIFWNAAYGPAIALRALEHPQSVFVAYLATTLVCVVIGIPVTRLAGLKGAIWVSNGADLSAFIVMMFMLRRRVSNS